MGRKAEPGIQYYSMRCDHINNKKVRLLFNDFGADGYWIWQNILAYSYAVKGYYFDLSDEEELALLASEQCKRDLQLVKDVIQACLTRKLFNKTLYDNYNILTSEHMQETYYLATVERRRKGTTIEVISEYVLCTPDNPRNINFIPLQNQIVPSNKINTPRNNDVPPVDDPDKAHKEAYKHLPEKDKATIHAFIRDIQPKFIEPYVDFWNAFAQQYDKPKVKLINDWRKKHFKTRINEKEFSIITILQKAAKSQMLITGSWFTFDWIIKSNTNYIKILEGNYDNPTQQPLQQQPVNSADEKLLQALDKDNK